MAGQRSQTSYRVIRRLATGGMAEVFLAESESVAEFQKTVAIKRVLPHLARNERFVRMFLDEARLAARLSHRNIVQVFDVGRVGESYFLVMEYVEGTNLKDVLEHHARLKRRVPVNIAVHVAIEMCNGLDYAHHLRDRKGKRLGVVHRDLSPANVLLSRAGGVRITDFGLAKAASQAEKTDPGMVKGKYGYLSPETASGGEADAKTDQFATAVVLWELLSGRRLFLGESNLDTVRLVREAKVPPLRAERDDVPAALERTLSRALARDKNDRFESCAAFSRTLTEILFEHRLPVSAQDVIALVSTVIGADVSGPNRALKTDEVPDTPDPEHRFEIHSIAERQSISPPNAVSAVDSAEHLAAKTPPPHAATDASPAPDSIDGKSTEAPANSDAAAAPRAWMPVSSPPPPLAPQVRRRRRWIVPVVAIVAIVVGAGAAVGDKKSAETLWQRAVAYASHRARVPDRPLSSATMTGETLPDRHVAHDHPTSNASSEDRTGAAHSSAAVDASSTGSDAATEAPPAVDQPNYTMQVALTHAIEARLPPCVTQFGHQFRHARVQVTYEGATGRPMNVSLVDTYFQQNPIGACIEAAVRAENAPRFRNPTWEAGFSFLIH